MSDPVYSADGMWRSFAEADEKGIRITVEVNSAAGPALVDCAECEAIHPVGWCEADDAT